MVNNECTIMQQISKAEEAIKTTYKRLENLEKKLSDKELPENKQKLVKRELDEVTKLLKTHEEQLSHLHTHNRKTFLFVAALIFIIFTVYVLYILVNGQDF